ncbi:MAG: pyruvate dehydrogenase (acetyl-transferring) E1 component subunit alpha [Phycisphaerales bacterium]
MPVSTAYKTEIQHLQILDEQGKLDEKLGKGLIADADLVKLYEHMSVCRQLDEIAFKLQRSGRMGTYPQNKGQEASATGVAFALKKSDWIVPCYRENAALFWHGLPMEKVLLHWMGDERGNEIPKGCNILPLSIPIGTHMLHAVGIGWAAKLRKEDTVVATFFGDGATSEGDFHEAMNFASAIKTPTVFICQNNGWAISVPIEKQTGSETFAQKALAYGMDTIRVDGNDIFAVHKAAKDAVERGRKHGTPSFIECLTYRYGDHTTADDARRYRDQAVLDEWLKKDPLIRIRKYLSAKKLWDDAKQEALETRAKEHVAEVVRNAEGIEKPASADFFDHMFAEIPADLALQRDTMRTNSLSQFPNQETLQRRAAGQHA